MIKSNCVWSLVSTSASASALAHRCRALARASGALSLIRNVCRTKQSASRITTLLPFTVSDIRSSIWNKYLWVHFDLVTELSLIYCISRSGIEAIIGQC